MNLQSSTAKWQAKVLQIVALLFIGMAIRDYVTSMFSSLFKLITSDFGATATLGVILTLFYFVMNVLRSVKFEKAVQKNNKVQNHNNHNNQYNNQNRR